MHDIHPETKAFNAPMADKQAEANKYTGGKRFIWENVDFACFMGVLGA